MVNRFTKMRDRDSFELKDTIDEAIQTCQKIVGEADGKDVFWKICAGVDAYFEQRRRKEDMNAYGQVPSDIPSAIQIDPSSPAGGSGEADGVADNS